MEPGSRFGKPSRRWKGKPEDHPRLSTPDPLAGTSNSCPKCGGARERQFFMAKANADRSHYRGWVCRPCKKKSYRAWAEKEGVKERVKIKNKERHRRNYFKNYWTPEKTRDQRLRLGYGITLVEYQAMHNAQEGVCAICGQPETAKRKGKTYPLSVDHDHAKEGRAAVRGLLCYKCNFALSRLEEVDGWTGKAIAYLDRFK